MTALTAGRDTRERTGNIREVPVKAATTIFPGAMVAIDSNGYAVPASTATTLKVIGRAEALFDNSDGGNGDIKARVAAGIFRYANSASSDLIALPDVGATCYAVDDQTVAKTNGSSSRSAAGTIFDVDSQGVWVRFA
ncbi:MAG: hypothetical protein J0H17_03875 [Rhizobiales bacterium]|nr:hypothetical protein [Hyphomicrobiales bacterium]